MKKLKYLSYLIIFALLLAYPFCNGNGNGEGDEREAAAESESIEFV